MRRVAPETVWPLTRGEGVLVAVVDSGVSGRIDALAGAVRPGVDVVNSGTGDRDCAGRGTALAGVVAARPVTGSGFVGTAPAATIFPVRIVDGRGNVGATALAQGIRAATEAGADVILIGIGTAEPDAALRSAVRAALDRDVVLVASVSDAKPAGVASGPAPWYPASDENVLAVGGVGTDGMPTEASPTEARVNLLAPAAGAVSTGPSGAGHYTVGGPAVAAAYVAGAAALVRAYHPELNQAEVRRRLELTAEPSPGGWPLSRVGHGTLDLYAAVAALEVGEEQLPSRRAGMIAVAGAPQADPAKTAAAVVAVGTVATAGLAYVLAWVLRRGRRRHWRP
ncbi:S8 family serine peptidase [Micromonospora zingiberis]|uniref:S8 family serine peptidase n=1 Tax=Micromonospora zingiberis TaxID=2053011 RepID=UPI0013F42D0C|nr:S8 family serine peptidase [Micromonospora zingiberis]